MNHTKDTRMNAVSAPQYCTVQEHAGAWRILHFGRPPQLDQHKWQAATEREAHRIADEYNRSLAPSGGGCCPVCGSTNTYTTGDGWLVCMNCGARTQ